MDFLESLESRTMGSQNLKKNLQLGHSSCSLEVVLGGHLKTQTTGHTARASVEQLLIVFIF